LGSEWGAAPLGELAEDILDRRGVTPLKLGSDFVSAGHRVISAKLVKSGRIDLHADEARFVDGATYKRWMRTPLLGDDVILTSEAPLGEVAYVTAANDWVLGQRLFAIRTDKRRLHGRFLYYALQSEPVIHELQSRATGTTAQGIRQSELRRVKVPLPPLAEQRAIAHILGTLDDKIELNRRMNETLEEIARALFKSWFVDFDPVRAKPEGRDPSLPPHLADLFPDSFEDSELGRIPKRWKVGSVGDEFDLTMGQSPPGETYNLASEGLPFYQGRVDFGFRFPTRRVYCTAPTRFAKAGDTLVSVRAPVGDINMASEDCAIGRGVAAVRHNTSSRSYSFRFMQSIAEVFALFEGEGTVFGSIGKKDFRAIPCLVPPRELVLAYEMKVSPLDDRVEVNELENRTLAALRDTLLTKLISGELRVTDPAPFHERVVE
jgi:type I restriction enzyme S subunit